MKPIHKVIPARMVREFKGGSSIKGISRRWRVTTADVIRTLKECMGGEYPLFVQIHNAIARKQKKQNAKSDNP